MIDITQQGFDWPMLWDISGQQQQLTVFSSTSVRDSKLLDATGEPLQVGYERPKLGFDLRKKNDR